MVFRRVLGCRLVRLMSIRQSTILLALTLLELSGLLVKKSPDGKLAMMKSAMAVIQCFLQASGSGGMKPPMGRLPRSHGCSRSS